MSNNNQDAICLPLVLADLIVQFLWGVQGSWDEKVAALDIAKIQLHVSQRHLIAVTEFLDHHHASGVPTQIHRTYRMYPQTGGTALPCQSPDNERKDAQAA